MLRLLLILLGGLALSSCGSDSAPTKPDIVLYLSDTLRADHLTAYGYARRTSPELERFAEDAVLFRQAFSPTAWTRPATASLLTGLDPLDHGTRSRASVVPEDLEMLGERLQAEGYYTVAVVTNAQVVGMWGFDQGYDVFVDLGAEAEAKGKAFADIPAAVAHSWVLGAIDQRPEDKPLFLYVHTIDAHTPNDPPGEFARLFSRRPQPPGRPGYLEPGVDRKVLDNVRNLYDGEIAYLDQEFGGFLDALRKRDLYDDSLLFFLSDHGEEHLEHGHGGHGVQLYNEVVRVPMLVRFPGGVGSGSRVDDLVSLQDVVPTVLTALGLPADPTLPGVDLQAVRDGTAPAGRSVYLDLDLAMDLQGGRHVSHGVIRDGYKYLVQEVPERKVMLYDLSIDPGETRDVAREHADVALALARDLEDHRSTFLSGLVFRLVGPREPGEGEVTVRLRSAGRIVEVRGIDLEKGDRVALDESGQELTLTATLDPVRDNVEGGVYQDQDAVSLLCDPPGAEVTVEAVLVKGTPTEVPVFLGPGCAEAGVPATVFFTDPELAAPGVGLDPGARIEYGFPEGLYISVYPGREAVAVDMDTLPPEMLERMKALGYLEDG